MREKKGGQQQLESAASSRRSRGARYRGRAQGLTQRLERKRLETSRLTSKRRMDGLRSSAVTPDNHLPHLLGPQPLNSALRIGSADKEGKFVPTNEGGEHNPHLGIDPSPPELAFLLSKRKHPSSEWSDIKCTVFDKAYRVAIPRFDSANSNVLSLASSAPYHLLHEVPIDFHTTRNANPAATEILIPQQLGSVYSRRMPQLVSSSMNDSVDLHRNDTGAIYPFPSTAGLNSWWTNDFLASFDKVVTQIYFITLVDVF